MTKLTLAFAVAAGVAVLAGCQSADESKDNAAMRDSMTSNKPFDINDVPPEHREMVMKMRGGGGASKAGATAPPSATK